MGVECNSDDKGTITIYSIGYDRYGNEGLIVTDIVGNLWVSKVTKDSKSEIIHKILENDLSFCILRRAVGNELLIQMDDYRTDSLFEMHLNKIRNFINNNKNNSKSMETKKIFIPFYLEYVKCLEPAHEGDYPSIIFEATNGDLFIISYRDSSISCSMLRYGFPPSIFEEKPVKGDRELLKSLGKVLLDKSFDNINFKLFWGFNDYTDRINKNDKNQFLLAILNCLDMNFSHKSMIENGLEGCWNRLKNIDNDRVICGKNNYKNCSMMLGALVESGRNMSNIIYEHFKNFSMRKKIDVSKITCIHDVEDDIKFIKLDVKKQCYGGDFDLIGVEERNDGGYNLVIREVTDKDLYLCRYRTLPDVEKDFVYDFVDKTKR